MFTAAWSRHPFHSSFVTAHSLFPSQSPFLFVARTRTLVLASGGIEVVSHGETRAAVVGVGILARRGVDAIYVHRNFLCAQEVVDAQIDGP